MTSYRLRKEVVNALESFEKLRSEMSQLSDSNSNHLMKRTTSIPSLARQTSVMSIASVTSYATSFAPTSISNSQTHSANHANSVRAGAQNRKESRGSQGSTSESIAQFNRRPSIAAAPTVYIPSTPEVKPYRKCPVI